MVAVKGFVAWLFWAAADDFTPPFFARVTMVPDDRSPQAIAYHWASRIMTVALEMVVPGVLGYWLDQWIGSRFVFTILGFAAGLIGGMIHLVRIASPPKSMKKTDSASHERSDR